jgi:hypothetical protein
VGRIIGTVRLLAMKTSQSSDGLSDRSGYFFTAGSSGWPRPHRRHVIFAQTLNPWLERSGIESLASQFTIIHWSPRPLIMPEEQVRYEQSQQDHLHPSLPHTSEGQVNPSAGSSRI